MKRKPVKTLEELTRAKASKLTTRELRKAIRHLAQSANVNISAFEPLGFKPTSFLTKQIKTYQRITGQTKGVGGPLGRGGLNRALRSQLVEQFQRLKIIDKELDRIYRAAPGAVEEERVNKSFETFKRHYGYGHDFTREQYETLVQIISSAKATLIEYGYEDRTYGDAMVRLLAENADIPTMKEVVEEAAEMVEAGGIKNGREMVEAMKKAIKMARIHAGI